MRRRLCVLSLILAVAFAVLIAACGGDQGDSSPDPSAVTPVPARPVSLSERVTFFGLDPGDRAGAIAAGDFNGDTVQDVVMAAAQADGPANARPDAGEAYLFLAPFTPGEARDPAQGEHDLVIYGAQSQDQLGRALTAGDVNGDGIDDIVLSAPFADGAFSDRPDAGQTYVVFGSSGFGGDTVAIDLAQGVPGIIVTGAEAEDLSGFSVQAADVNGDGLSDLIIGAMWADGPANDRSKAGEVYIVYGSNRRGQIDLARSEQDVTILGAEADDRLGEAVGAGDVNGDGLADVIAAATFAAGPDNDREAAGEVYIMPSPQVALIDLAEDFEGTTVLGADAGDQLGHSIASGDHDGDGSDDVLMGAVSADGRDNLADLSGEARLSPGSESPPDLVDASVAEVGALIYGASSEDRLGRSAAMGDVNGDGLSDLVIAAPGAGFRAGAIYVVYGSAGQPYRQASAAAADVTVEGLDQGDALGSGVFGGRALAMADLNADGLTDILVSAPEADGPDNQRVESGEAYAIIISGPGSGRTPIERPVAAMPSFLPFALLMLPL